MQQAASALLAQHWNTHTACTLCLQAESERQDTEQQLSRIQAAISKQERDNILLAITLRERRHYLNVTKHTQETATIKALHRNDAWLRQKLQKNALHSKLCTVRDQRATLQVQAHSILAALSQGSVRLHGRTIHVLECSRQICRMIELELDVYISHG